MSKCSINKLINSGEREAIFLACLIKIDVINTYSLLFIIFLNEDYICKPLRIVDLIDKVDL